MCSVFINSLQMHPDSFLIDGSRGVKGDRENNKSFLKIVSPLLHSAQLHFNIPLIYIIIIYV